MLKFIPTQMVEIGKKLVDKLMLRDAGSVILIVVVVVCGIAGVVSNLWFGPDNHLEEISEEVIKNKTGVDVDLSPSTPEEKPISYRRDLSYLA